MRRFASVLSRLVTPVMRTSAVVLMSGSVLLEQNKMACAPTFHGVPVPTHLLVHQAYEMVHQQFPGLEMSPVFMMDHPEYLYEESGLLQGILSTGVAVELPLFEKLSESEEFKLGASGLRKQPVGYVRLEGSCKLNCAQVSLTKIVVLKADRSSVVWQWPSSDL